MPEQLAQGADQALSRQIQAYPSCCSGSLARSGHRQALCAALLSESFAGGERYMRQPYHVRLHAELLLSADSMEETLKNARLFGTGGQQVSQDFLNKIAPSGLPPHKLTLKEGAPVMLLRNMDGARGPASGIRVLICNIHSRCHRS